MIKQWEIEFVDSKPKSLKTKFGGQPDWIKNPEWPISKQTGNPMRFICQIDLNEIESNSTDAKFAYVFITDEQEYVDDTWEPNGGENAIILQPGSNEIKTQELKEGPTLYSMVKKRFRSKLVPKDFESDVKLVESAEEIYQDEEEILNKIGGNPVFIQGEEYPDDSEWDLLIQLDSTTVPFYINFGDGGVGYGFISRDGKRAKLLWQCG